MLPRVSKACLCAVIAAAVLAGFLSGPSTRGGDQSDSPLQSHPRIAIDGDQDFTTANGAIGGRGTPLDPFIIEGWNITVDDWHQVGVSITNTSAHFILRNLSVQASGPAYESWAVSLVSVQHGTIDQVRGFGKGWEEMFAGFLVDNSSAVTLTGSEFVPGGLGAGILVRDSTDVAVTANLAQRIFVQRSSDVRVLRNNITVEVAIDSADRVTLAENEIYKRYVYDLPSSLDFASMKLTSTRNSTMWGNLLTNAGIDIAGSSLEDYTTNTITLDNLVNGKPVRFYKDCANVVVSGVATGQVFVANCENVSISGLNLSYSNVGIRLVSVHNVTIENSTFMWDYPRAVDIDQSSNVTITGSRFAENSIAFLLRNSQSLLVYHNDFLSNWGEIFNPSSIYDNRSDVRWDSGYPLGGNFWYDYAGADRCRGPGQDDCGAGDGIGDTPFDIPAWYLGPTAGTDRYPLLRPVTEAPATPWSPILGIVLVTLLTLALVLAAFVLFRRRRKRHSSLTSLVSDKPDSSANSQPFSETRISEGPPERPPTG